MKISRRTMLLLILPFLNLVERLYEHSVIPLRKMLNKTYFSMKLSFQKCKNDSELTSLTKANQLNKIKKKKKRKRKCLQNFLSSYKRLGLFLKKNLSI